MLYSAWLVGSTSAWPPLTSYLCLPSRLSPIPHLYATATVTAHRLVFLSTSAIFSVVVRCGGFRALYGWLGDVWERVRAHKMPRAGPPEWRGVGGSVYVEELLCVLARVPISVDMLRETVRTVPVRSGDFFLFLSLFLSLRTLFLAHSVLTFFIFFLPLFLLLNTSKVLY